MLKEKQAIIRMDTPFGMSDYFMAEIVENNGKQVIRTHDVNIDKIKDKLKSLKIDCSNSKMTAYCKPGYSFKEDWDSIPNNEKCFV